MITDIVERHIALHRSTGYLFRSPAALLRLFARFADAREEDVVRTHTVLEWAAQAPTAGTRRGRLHIVRRFARLSRSEDPRHEVPPPDVFGPRPQRRTPFIFSMAEIHALLDAASALGPIGSIRAPTYTTFFGLIASTGLRVSEAIALRLDDITVDGLVIHESKFRKSRLVPVHTTTRDALDTYIGIRARVAGADRNVFVSDRGTRLAYPTVNATFLKLVRKLGLHPGAGKRGPRIHDLRHAFAVRSIEQCPSGRDAVARHVHALSTYLGHAHLWDTYWYLEATPRLLADISDQGELLATRGAP